MYTLSRRIVCVWRVVAEVVCAFLLLPCARVLTLSDRFGIFRFVAGRFDEQIFRFVQIC